jgi:hypothetical protein
LKLTGKIAEAAATCAIERSFEASDFLSHIVCNRHFEAAKRPAALTSATIALFASEEDLLAHAVQNLVFIGSFKASESFEKLDLLLDYQLIDVE